MSGFSEISKLCATAKLPFVSSMKMLYVRVAIWRVTRKFSTFCLFCSRYSNWRLISSIVLCLRSSNHGDSFFAQFLHKLPSSNFRFPSNPIFSPHISQFFLSNNPILTSPFYYFVLQFLAFLYCFCILFLQIRCFLIRQTFHC